MYRYRYEVQVQVRGTGTGTGTGFINKFGFTNLLFGKNS
jgi:hypothetical protein